MAENGAVPALDILICVQGAAFLEQVCCPSMNLQLHRYAHLPHRVAVHLDHRFVVAADNQQRGRLHMAARCERFP